MRHSAFLFSTTLFALAVLNSCTQEQSDSPTGNRPSDTQSSSNIPGRPYSNTTPGQPSDPRGDTGTDIGGAEDGTTGSSTGVQGTRGGSYGDPTVKKTTP